MSMADNDAGQDGDHWEDAGAECHQQAKPKETGGDQPNGIVFQRVGNPVLLGHGNWPSLSFGGWQSGLRIENSCRKLQADRLLYRRIANALFRATLIFRM